MSNKGSIFEIQTLRAIAATCVVYGHASGSIIRFATSGGDHFAMPRVASGAGVDLFFVISGFIMYTSSLKLFGQPNASAVFMKRRLIRIVPLYWLCTSLFIAMLAVQNLTKGAAFPDLRAILASYFFIPYSTGDLGPALAFPIYDLGWTLNYEMFFYLIFAALVFLSARSAVLMASTIMPLIVLAGAISKSQNTALYFWSSPIILEFLIGMIVASLRQEGLFVPPVAVVPTILASIAWILLDPFQLVGLPGTTTPNDFQRLAGWGIPMSSILAVLTLRPLSEPNRIVRAVSHLGDASYALYLTHPFVLILVLGAARYLRLQSLIGYFAIFIFSMLLAMLVSLIVFRCFEVPVGKLLRRSRTDRLLQKPL